MNRVDVGTGTFVRIPFTEWVSRGGQVAAQSTETKAFVPFDLLPQSLDTRALAVETRQSVEVARAALAKLEGVTLLLPIESLLAKPFQTREAQASSRIEDTNASALEIEIADMGLPNSSPDAILVANYRRALHAGLQHPDPVSLHAIRSMHAVLMRGTDPRKTYPGELRPMPVYIGDKSLGVGRARFVPPPPEHVLGLMERLVAFLKTPRDDLSPLAVAALAHYQFETIHPFADGNGRLGRLLITLSLIQSSVMQRPLLYLSSFFEAHRTTYVDLLLAVSTEGRWADWVRFFCQAVAIQANDAIIRALELLMFRRKWTEKATESRLSAKFPRCVDFLFESPVFTAAMLGAHLQTHPTQTYRYIKKLVEFGIVKEMTGRDYDRVFAATAILEVIERDSPTPGEEAQSPVA